MPRKRLLRQLFLSFVSVVLVCVLGTSWFASKAVEDVSLSSAAERLQTAARLAADEAVSGARRRRIRGAQIARRPCGKGDGRAADGAEGRRTRDRRQP